LKEYFLDEPGISFRANDFHEGRGTLVFIHGLTGSASAWLRYEQRFSQSFNVVVVDLRGHGMSKRLSSYDDYSLEKCAEDVRVVLNTLRVQQCALVAHSLGTLVALKLAKEISGVRAMALLSPVFGVRQALSGRALHRLLRLAHHALGLFPPRSRSGRVDYARFTNSGDRNVWRILADIYNTGIHSHLFLLLQVYEAKTDDEWQAVKVPTVILHGENDTLVPVTNAIELAKRIEGVKLLIFKHTDHLFILSQFEQAAAAISDFLATVPIDADVRR
jgi:pimeloyl-ACP methyl ester carboxylesterase